MEKYATTQVYGVSVKPVLSYHHRNEVDEKFKKALHSDKHIVIYGGSKQGKTSLRLKHIDEQNASVKYTCVPSTTQKTIFEYVLSKERVQVERDSREIKKGGGSIITEVDYRAKVPFSEIGGKIAVEGNSEMAHEVNYEFIPFRYEDPQSFCEILNRVNFKKFIVIENFHYLNLDVQKSLSRALKAFHEAEIMFIILGVWEGAMHINTLNSDLSDRLVEIPVEPWRKEDLFSVARKGEPFLNIKVDDDILREFIENCYGNVGMLQEFLLHFCLGSGIEHTVDGDTPQVLGSKDVMQNVFDSKLKEYRGQLLDKLKSISSASRIDGADPLILPYYLVRIIIESDIEQIHKGFEHQRLLDKIREVHHRPQKDSIQSHHITHLLNRLKKIQENMATHFLFYDDSERRLRVVDAHAIFCLSRCDKQNLLDDIPFPLDEIDE